MEHTLLDPKSLSIEAQRALGAGPAKMMAAKGLAPLPNPVDLLSVLYQLALDGDAKVAEAAKGTVDTLPDAVLQGALGNPSTDPRVIDLVVRRLVGKTKLVDVVILNQGTGDSTIAWLASQASQKQVDLIAQNEQRILRHPDIIAALYQNANARMSTVDRVVELAVRNDVKVAGIPAWDEVVRAIMQSGKEDAGPKPSPEEMDALFEQVAKKSAAEDESSPSSEDEGKKIQIRDMTVPMKIRLAMMGNKFDRSQLIRDPKKIVAMAVIKSPAVKENEAAKYASNNSLCEEVIGYIASRREWTKGYNIKLALVTNPKCPLQAAMRLMPHLRIKDIRGIARSKGVPSALSAQAKKLTMARGGNKR